MSLSEGPAPSDYEYADNTSSSRQLPSLPQYQPPRPPDVFRNSLGEHSHGILNNPYSHQTSLPAQSTTTGAPPWIPVGTPVLPDAPSHSQSPAHGARRKAARARQACDQCRAKKMKCDESHPACRHCTDNNLNCTYMPPRKVDETPQNILDRLEQFGGKCMERFSHLDRQLAVYERMLSKGIRSSRPPRDTPLKMELTTLPEESLDEKPGSFTSQALAKADPTATRFDEQANSQNNEGELSIPVEHTTAAHKLLMWPSIKSLIRHPGYDEDYVMQLEKDRPIISAFGEGESSFSSGFLLWAMARNRMAENKTLETPGTVLPDGLLPEPEVDDDNWPSLPYNTAKRYYDCYMSKMHTLHPFLDQPSLWQTFIDYTRRHCTGYPLPPNGYGSPKDEMSIDNAIILLVFALGAICETPDPLPGLMGPLDYRKQYIPGPPQPRKPEPNGIQAANRVPSPTNSDSALPTGTSFYTRIPSTNHSFPVRIEPTPPRKSMSNGAACTEGSGRPKNYRVIPGLFLFGYATMILGTLQGVGTLKSVQARLLAGLYAGQLAHPFQSHAWISDASRSCQVLIAPKSLDAASKKMQDLICFTFWTCLQLESDLLAELDIPASGISRSESQIGLPSRQYSLGFPDDTDMLYYSAQIHLRKLLNRVHTDLYKVASTNPQHCHGSMIEHPTKQGSRKGRRATLDYPCSGSIEYKPRPLP
ncbi:hypothetical protein N7470_000598 [Penicillium chermesinum]|nr:hypothetical protein N7470_000598 [Penicillium chermesinum]